MNFSASECVFVQIMDEFVVQNSISDFENKQIIGCSKYVRYDKVQRRFFSGSLMLTRCKSAMFIVGLSDVDVGVALC